MKVIFLDVDGVLNCETYWRRDRPKGWCYWAPENVAQLKRLTDEVPEAKIVVSSTWRKAMPIEAFREMIAAVGIDPARVIDYTPEGKRRRLSQMPIRGDEIQEWINEHPDVEDFVILDDNSDMAHLMPRLIKTTWMRGLEAEHVDEAVRRLKR